MTMSEILDLVPGKELDKLVAIHVMALKEGIDFGTFKEHEWRKDEDGDIDNFAMDSYNHNGPRCIRCGHSYCIHCDDEEDKNKPCISEPSYYSSAAFGILHENMLRKIGGTGIYSFKYIRNPTNSEEYVWSICCVFKEIYYIKLYSKTLSELVCKFTLLRVFNFI